MGRMDGQLSQMADNSVMSGFRSHTGKLAVYNGDHIDTDRIIPARFLSMVTKSGYGELLFNDVRGPEFPLDQAEAKDASILVVGTNFGCGSSREHAVWAIQQAGFKAVVAKLTDDNLGYSDIFRSNAANCGLCLIELPESDHSQLVAAGSGADATIDLESKQIRLGSGVLPFEMKEATRQQLLLGLDLIGTTLQHEAKVSAFEKNWDSFSPRSGVSV